MTVKSGRSSARCCGGIRSCHPTRFRGLRSAIRATIRLRADERLDPGSRWHSKPSTGVVCLRGRAGWLNGDLPPLRLGWGNHGVVSGVRDYLAWHEQYDDLESSLSPRLALVREVLRAELDARPGPVRVVT